MVAARLLETHPIDVSSDPAGSMLEIVLRLVEEGHIDEATAANEGLILPANHSQLPQDASRYRFVGVEQTGESTIEERQARLKDGFHSHPVAWGIAIYREVAPPDMENPDNIGTGI